MTARFAGVLAVEGEPTGDGRMIGRGALVWPDPTVHNVQLMFQTESTHGPAMNGPLARMAGRITRIWRDGDQVMAEGDFAETDDGREAADLMGQGMLTGVSIDPDDVPASSVEVICTETDADGVCLDEMVVFHQLRIRGATLVPFQAILNARLELVTDTVDAAVAAAAYVVAAGRAALAEASDPLFAPPREWFDDPHLTALTPLTITPEGRIYGHIAPWNLCHAAYAPRECRPAPRSPSGYSYFHTSTRYVSCCGDCPPEALRVGRLTHSGLHAGVEDDVVAHHEDASLIFAHARAGEDEFGIWAAGALIPGLTREQVVTLQGAPLSGHWQPDDTGRNELRIAHTVNNPGYTILAAVQPDGSLVAGGRPMVVEPRTEPLIAAVDRAASTVMAAIRDGSVSYNRPTGWTTFTPEMAELTVDEGVIAKLEARIARLETYGVQLTAEQIRERVEALRVRVLANGRATV